MKLRPYWNLFAEWQAIVAQPGSDKEKRDACMAALRVHVDRLARNRVGQENAPLRFYADMVVLRSDVLPVLSGGQEGKVALGPAFAAVRNWLLEHAHLNAGGSSAVDPLDLKRLVGTIYAPVPKHRLQLDGEPR